MKYDKVEWCVGTGCPMAEQCVHHMALRHFFDEYGSHAHYAISPMQLRKRCEETEHFEQWDAKAYEAWLWKDLEEWMNANPAEVADEHPLGDDSSTTKEDF